MTSNDPSTASVNAEVEAELAEDQPTPIGPIALLTRRIVLIVVLPVFSSAYLWQALSIPMPARQLVVSPRAFPTVVACLMLVVAIAIAVTEVIKIARAKGATEGTDDFDIERISSWRDAWVALGAYLVYVLVFPHLGFLVATVLFIIALSTYLAPKKWLRNTIVAVVFTAAIYALFTTLLSVRLPAGILSGLI